MKSTSVRKILPLLFSLAAITLILGVFYFSSRDRIFTQSYISYTEFLRKLDSDEISRVTIQGRKLFVNDKSGNSVQTLIPELVDIVPILKEKQVDIDVISYPWYQVITDNLILWLPLLAIFLVSSYFLLGHIQKIGQSNVNSWGKSPARLHFIENPSVTFENIAGLEEVKRELFEIIDFLKHSEKYIKLNARIPRGVLLKGPPGTGKTLLAKAIAGEAGVPFFSTSGSDFVEIFVGVGASRARDLFAKAKENAPCIIFIDEIDAIGNRRGSSGGAHSEKDQTINQLLVEMDGFDSNDAVIVLAATNMPDVLDPALLRPGRFDRTVSIQYPKTDEREMILRVHTKNISLESDVSLRRVAELTPGFSGADISTLINEAKILAVKENKTTLSFVEVEKAIDKVRRRRKEKITVETSEDKWRVSIHECGHLSASFEFPCLENIESLSIFNLYQPEWFYGGEVHLPQLTRQEVAKGTVAVLLSGRAAEEFFLNEASNLSENDIAISTALVYEMFSRWGMNKNLGLVNDRLVHELAVLQAVQSFINPNKEVHEEIKRFLEEAYKLALEQVEKNATNIVEWASELYEKELLGYKNISNIRARTKFKSEIKQLPISANREPIKSNVDEDVLVGSSGEEDHLTKKVAILKRNKQILELQLAKLGVNAPPHLVTQLEDIEDELKNIRVG